jgi:PKHD-type hydroxylase
MPWFLGKDKFDERWAWVQVFTEQECIEIIKLGKKSNLNKALINDGEEDEKRRITDICWFRCEREYFSEFEWIYRRCTDVVKNINEKFFNYDLTFIEELQFTAYNKKGSFYGKHIDSTYEGNTHRKLSFTIQLSDEKMYKGGDLLLYNSKDPDNAPKGIGVMTIFPSWTLHEVTPIKQGERYSLVGWVCGPKFK